MWFSLSSDIPEEGKSKTTFSRKSKPFLHRNGKGMANTEKPQNRQYIAFLTARSSSNNGLPLRMTAHLQSLGFEQRRPQSKVPFSSLAKMICDSVKVSMHLIMFDALRSPRENNPLFICKKIAGTNQLNPFPSSA